MNIDDLLQMTVQEIEDILNKSVYSISFESHEDNKVRMIMKRNAFLQFDDVSKISLYSSDYGYETFSIYLIKKKLCINFKVRIKRTDKTVDVSKLRKKYIKTVGKFKFEDITCYVSIPNFTVDNLDEYKIQQIGGHLETISLKHRREKIKDMISKEILVEEIQNQVDGWGDIREAMILNMAQPLLRYAFKTEKTLTINQEKWDNILRKTEESNKELIDYEINKLTTLKQ